MTQAEERGRYYSYTFAVDGRSFYFGAEKPLTPTSTTTREGVSGAEGYISGGIPPGLPQVEIPDLGTVTFVCPSDLVPPGYQPSATVLSSSETVPTDSNGIEWWLQGPPQAVWTMGEYEASLSSSSFDGLCDPGDQPDAELLAMLGRLRLGTHADLQEVLADVADPDALPAEVTTVPTTTTTTTAQNPPADRRTAEEQITAAVAGLQDRDADGSYPNLEDGVSRADQYASAFALAAAQSGADQVADPRSGPFTLRDLTFTSSERATITFDAGAHLPSGDFTFAISGNAVLQDGRWVLTYDTIADMVGRACLPPGGVTSVCVKGRND